ncbi:MAG: hypothetical protein GTO18_08695 [Anaerolineales bacterium]|nr:hypothetical protein [Anaerolineales bacterium]
MKDYGYQPDFERFRQHIKRQSVPGPVPIAEYLVDGPTIEKITGEKFPSELTDGILDWTKLSRTEVKEINAKVADLITKACLQIGLDYSYVELDSGLNLVDSIPFRDDKSTEREVWWYIDSHGPIQNWQDFERFPWPEPQTLDFTTLDIMNQDLPEGMQIFILTCGAFDLTSWSMGFENLAVALHDQLELVEAIVDRVSDILAYQIETSLQYDRVGGIWFGDDLGFHSGTLIHPDMIRKIILPHHKRFVKLAHDRDKLFFLHACGNVGEIMPDIIAMGVDAKHSFEDKILPVEDAYQRWGGKIGIVGGLDMDLITRGSEEEIRRRTREILDVCGPKGGYALGTGNSVADYVPINNFLVMLDEGRRWNQENFPS